ncbi:DUF6053 domain-containing protein [Lysobacter enzymogenes]
MRQGARRRCGRAFRPGASAAIAPIRNTSAGPEGPPTTTIADARHTA